jgi:hypothetical protein
MTTIRTLLHLTALASCLTAHLAFSGELDGIRRALETIGGASQPHLSLLVTPRDEAVS